MGKVTQSNSIEVGDWIVYYDNTQGDYRGIPLSDFLVDVQAALTLGRAEADTQYAAPSATAFSVQILDDDKDVHLILTPTAGFADGEIVLPLSTRCRDKQEVTVNCTQAVTAFVVDGNGATAVTGAPTTLAANAYFKLCYDLATSTWYRIG